MDKPDKKPAKLTKANLEQLKEQLHESLAQVKPRYGDEALGFQELVCGFRDRVHAMAEEKAWKQYLKDREKMRKSGLSDRYNSRS